MQKGQKQSGRNINFRETHSERSATASYKNFGAEAKGRARLRAKAKQAWDAAAFIKGNRNSRSFGRGR